MSRRRAILVALCALLSFGSACTTVGITGRSQAVWVPESVQNQLGLQAWQQTLSAAPIVTSGAQAEMVKRIGSRVAEAARRHPELRDTANSFHWEFVLIDDPAMANAWALPGGKCAVYTGLLPITRDEDSLAAVMGHEVAHALAHHGGERMTQQLMVNAGLSLAQIASNDMDAAQRATLLAALGIASQTGVLLPFSRTHESEADHIGLLLAADAGYDPRASVGLWERMGAMGGQRPPELLSTHPSEATRIRRLKELMPNSLEIYRQAKAQGR